MATTLPAPMQPDLRSFIVYDRCPARCIAFPIADDRSLPHLRPGDVAVVDAADREPIERELFLIEWNDGGREIIETFSRAGRFGCGPAGEMIDTHCWFVGPYNRPRTFEAAMAEARRTGILRGLVDGPYATEGRNAGVLQSKLVGRVVGILASSVRGAETGSA